MPCVCRTNLWIRSERFWKTGHWCDRHSQIRLQQHTLVASKCNSRQVRRRRRDSSYHHFLRSLHSNRPPVYLHMHHHSNRPGRRQQFMGLHRLTSRTSMSQHFSRPAISPQSRSIHNLHQHPFKLMAHHWTNSEQVNKKKLWKIQTLYELVC